MNSKVVENINKEISQDQSNTTVQKKKKRIDYIDIARGITIILMIVAHNPVNNLTIKIIYSFHLPLFIIVSGMFFKEDESFGQMMKKLVKGLLLPLFVAFMAKHFLEFAFLGKPFEIKKLLIRIALLNELDVIWFFPILFVCKLFFWFINKISKNDEVLKCLLSIFFSMLGIYFAFEGMLRWDFDTWKFDVYLAVILFFYIGYIFQKTNTFNKILHNYKYLLVIFGIYLVCLKFGYIHLAAHSFPNGITSYLTAICGTILLFKICMIIEKVIYIPILNIVPNVFKWLGKNSMYVLCFHYMERFLVPYSKLHITSSTQKLIIEILIITICVFALTCIQKTSKKIVESIKSKKAA